MRINRYPTRPPDSRAGYTLVEMLVSAGVSLLIMVILTGAFQAGLDTFRKMRAHGNMQERLRMARQTLADDLASPHFRGWANGTSAHDYVSGQDLRKWQNTWSPPADGFFRIWQAPDPDYPVGPGMQLPIVPEGTDNVNNLMQRARTHELHFTVRRVGAGPDHMFRAQELFQHPVVPAFGGALNPNRAWPADFVDPTDYRENGFFTSQWAEVAWFMASNGNSAGGLPLYDLYRRQKLLLPSTLGTDPVSPPTQQGVSQSNQVTQSDLDRAQVVVGNNAGFQPAGTYNPDMSIRAQYNNPTAPNFTYFYNHCGWPVSPPLGINYGDACVTQPRFRFGMVPAHDYTQPIPNGPLQSIDAQFLGGWPAQVPFPPNNPVFYTKPYLTIKDELDAYDSPNPNSPNHQAFDSNDLVLTDVLSFEIKVLWDTNPNLPPTANAQLQYSIPSSQGPLTVNNGDYPFDYLPYSDQLGQTDSGNNILYSSPNNGGLGVRVFDTWSQHGIYRQVQNSGGSGKVTWPQWKRNDLPGVSSAVQVPLRIRVKAVLIRIRIWDQKAEQARQITIYQDI